MRTAANGQIVSALQAEAWPRWHGRPFYGKVSMAWWQGVVSGGESARDSARGRALSRVQPDHGGARGEQGARLAPISSCVRVRAPIHIHVPACAVGRRLR